MGLDTPVQTYEAAEGRLVVRTPVIADNLYMNGSGYQGLYADSASRAFEVSRDSADNVPPLNMASNDSHPAGTVL